MGHEAQRRMACSDVLVVGLSGLGVEVSKITLLYLAIVCNISQLSGLCVDIDNWVIFE